MVGIFTPTRRIDASLWGEWMTVGRRHAHIILWERDFIKAYFEKLLIIYVATFVRHLTSLLQCFYQDFSYNQTKQKIHTAFWICVSKLPNKNPSFGTPCPPIVIFHAKGLMAQHDPQDPWSTISDASFKCRQSTCWGPTGPKPTCWISKNPTHSHVGEDGGKIGKRFWSKRDMGGVILVLESDKNISVSTFGRCQRFPISRKGVFWLVSI